MPVQQQRVPTVLASNIANKSKRNEIRIRQKRAKEVEKREARFARKKEEARNPRLKEERLARNVPQTIESKRQWDEVEADWDGEEGNLLGVAVDLVKLAKRRKIAEEEAALEPAEVEEEVAEKEKDSDADSMLDDSEGEEQDDLVALDEDEEDDEDDTQSQAVKKPTRPTARAPSPTISTTSTRLDLTPSSLASKFPSLFNTDPNQYPKILITTCLNSTLHREAELLTELFPNSKYVPRSAHRHSHKFSVREISGFAANKGYTTVIILNEWKKRPSGLDIVHLPEGPMFHFTMSNWIEGKRLPGHGNATGHDPELILNNFRTPLGLLTAHLFRTMFPQVPQLVGRQVVTMHNQRDFIFFRRHRYVFRDKRATEKSVIGADGKIMEGAEDIRAGLQELGPRFTLKLRRVDKGIQRKSGQEWEWKGKTDRVRTKFQL